MLQTAEGAMAVMDDLLIRMKELAEQSSTDSYSDTQRGIMDAEFQQLASEITRISDSTGFNNINLLNSNTTFNFHVGSSSTIDITAEIMGAVGLGLGATGSAQNLTNLTAVANANATGYITGIGGGGPLALTFGAEAEIAVGFADAAK